MCARLKGFYEVLLIGIGLAIIICFISLNRNKNNARSSRMACYRFFTYGGITLEKLGDFDEEADLIIMNHQSVADILCLEAYHPRNICWIAKKQLGEIPFYGYALTGPEMILIDRDDKRGLASLLKATKQKLSQNRPIVIFPEGTRSKGKERFLPFKPGAKIIAEKFRLKIQPIVLINTRRIYNSSPIEATSNVARMVLLKPFYADEHPSTQVFYRDESSLTKAKTDAKKIKGLQPIYDPSSSYFIAPTESTQSANSAEPLESWYEELQQCMQEVYTHHYRILNQA